MQSELFDVAVIGAGVVGCAVARRLALAGARVLVVEKGSDILSGASKANSAILHTGFDAPEGSLELQCMKDGYAEYIEIRNGMNLPLLETGALVAAWTAEEEARLPVLEAQARANGVDDVSIVGASEIRHLEPNLSGNARAALRVPREFVIDPWSPFLGYARQVLALGGRFVFDAEMTGGRFDGEAWTLTTTGGVFRAGTVVNCAGLQGDRVEALLTGKARFEIRPRKGQFAVFDKAASALLTAIILPVPSERTKGVVLCRTAFGNVLIGPTAEEQTDRVHATVSEPELAMLLTKAADMLPALRSMPVTAVYAGLRPASEEKHYRIHRIAETNYIAVGGIRSTGMTAALGIARHVAALLGSNDPASAEVPAIRMPVLAEHGERDWQRAGYAEIVCHCELVTRREIEAALDAPLPPRDLSALKRRTRCAMGRCQGFGCLGRLSELTAGRLEYPMGADISR